MENIKRKSFHFRLWIPAVCFGFLLVFVPLPAKIAIPAESVHRIEASSYEFSPPVIHVNRGDQITIELVAKDFVHGIYLDGYDLDVVADPGKAARITFEADKAGTFRFRCSVTCGALHPFMIGKLQVGPNWLFWRLVAAAMVLAVAGAWSRVR